MALHRRSTVFSSDGFSLQDPPPRCFFQICSMQFISGMYVRAPSLPRFPCSCTLARAESTRAAARLHSSPHSPFALGSARPILLRLSRMSLPYPLPCPFQFAITFWAEKNISNIPKTSPDGKRPPPSSLQNAVESGGLCAPAFIPPPAPRRARNRRYRNHIRPGNSRRTRQG